MGELWGELWGGRLDGFLSFRPHAPSATETASARLSASLGRSQLAGGVAAICSINSISRRWTKAASSSGWVASQLRGATLCESGVAVAVNRTTGAAQQL